MAFLRLIRRKLRGGTIELDLSHDVLQQFQLWDIELSIIASHFFVCDVLFVLVKLIKSIL